MMSVVDHLRIPVLSEVNTATTQLASFVCFRELDVCFNKETKLRSIYSVKILLDQ